MTSAEFWQYAVVAAGTLDVLVFVYLVYRARKTLAAAGMLMGVLIVGATGYSAVLWGGQLLGVWTITPEYGRPAQALALFVVLWLGILALGQRSK